MIHLIIRDEDKTLFAYNVEMDYMIRTKPTGTWVLLNGSTIHGLVAFKAEQQMGLDIQPPSTLTLWVRREHAAGILRAVKVLRVFPRAQG